MKKIIGLLLAVFLVLPMTVKADTIFVNSFCNDKTNVGSEVVVNTILEYDIYPSKMEYTYDPTMLSITKENVSTPGSSDTVEISNGKVTIVVYEKGAIDTYGRGYVTLRFTALKAGTTTIEPFLGVGYSSLPGKLEIKISEVSSNVEKEPVETTTPIEDKTDAKEERTEPTTPTEEKTDKNDDNNILLYCSLGANALLAVALVAVILKKKTQKNVVAE